MKALPCAMNPVQITPPPLGYFLKKKIMWEIPATEFQHTMQFGSVKEPVHFCIILDILADKIKIISVCLFNG